MDNRDNKVLSVLVCTRDEEQHIGQCLQSLLEQKGLNGPCEILVIDGMSTDKTREIVTSKMSSHNQIVFFNNPEKVKAAAVNIGFKEAKGNYIAICDAHAIFVSNYLSECINILEERFDVWCAGGPIVSLGYGYFGKANALAMSIPIGIGNAKHRYPNYEGYAEMACFPVFRRDVLEKVGYYDGKFIHNHDDEFCFRLRKAGGKVYLSPKARSYYFVRDNPKELFRQYFGYGYWQIAFLFKHKIAISVRRLIPFIFYFSVIVFIIISISLNILLLGVILPVIYFGIIVIRTIPVIVKYGLGVGLNFPLAVFLLHFSYALGFLKGMIDLMLAKKLRNTHIFRN